jgi:hypothetical protein
MAEGGADAQAERVDGETKEQETRSAKSGLATAQPSAVFDELDAPPSFEAEEDAGEHAGPGGSGQKRALRLVSVDSNSGTSRGSTALPSPAGSVDGGSGQSLKPMTLLGLTVRRSRSADAIKNGNRVEMSSPRDRGGFARSGATTHAWLPFALFSFATLANWVVCFAMGASWREHGHRYYFGLSFTASIVMHSYQGLRLAELLEGTATAVAMECTSGLRQLMGLFVGWLGLVPTMLAYIMLRHGVDNNAFAFQFNKLTFTSLAGNSIPLAFLWFFVGVHEAWLDHTDPRFSALLAVSVASTVVTASATAFAWQAVSRNPGSTEVFYDAGLSICAYRSLLSSPASLLLCLSASTSLLLGPWLNSVCLCICVCVVRAPCMVMTISYANQTDGILSILAGALELGVLMGWLAVLPCAGDLVVTAPVAAVAVVGYYGYLYAASGVNAWSPRFALLWLGIKTALLVLVAAVFLLVSEDDGSSIFDSPGAAAALLAATANTTAQETGSWGGGVVPHEEAGGAYDATPDVDDDGDAWQGGHCFEGRTRAELLRAGIGGWLVVLALSLLAMLVDPQVGLSCCRRQTCLVAEHYSALFGPSSASTAAKRQTKSGATSDFDMFSSQDSDPGYENTVSRGGGNAPLPGGGGGSSSEDSKAEQLPQKKEQQQAGDGDAAAAEDGDE